MHAAMELCVSCKGCKRECPTGVDMARMKIEFLHHYHRRHGLRLKDRLIAWLPRYAPWGVRLGFLLNLRDRLPGLPWLSEKLLGFSARRPLPRWRHDIFNPEHESAEVASANGLEVVLLCDTFSTYFEPENARAALAVLRAAAYRVLLPRASDGARPLCCGRTFLSAGLVDEAQAEARRLLDALRPYIERGLPVIGLEPSCLLTLRDEFQVMSLGATAGALPAQAMLFEEFLAREQAAGRLRLKLQPLAAKRALLHGHCHQKAFGAMTAVQEVLRLVPELEVQTVESSCCGMAGAFGYEAGHHDVSMKMGELNLLPAVRAATTDTLIVADGTSCRQQIRDGAQREAIHVARVLEQALAKN
jgi:Fe-S oxidoreductase